MKNKPIIAVMMGDGAGCGSEIIAKTIVSNFYSSICRPLFIGDKRILDRAFKVIGDKAEIKVINNIQEADWDNENVLYFYDMSNIPLEDAVFGENSIVCGKACLEQMDMVVDLYKNKIISGAVFAPFNKAAMYSAGLKGESEHDYFKTLFDEKGYCSEINFVDDIWTTRVTSHVPISKVSESLNTKDIEGAIELANNTLLSVGYKKPRIAVAALNPHSGESGKCGSEEIDIIKPAIDNSISKGIAVAGPISADVIFIKAFAGEYDAVVTMYHDQGQIALKLHGFDHGVTIVGGMPMPIATCAHGTAYDIAGTGTVRTTAFEKAVEIVVSMANKTALVK